MREKKGISAIIATVMIILITVAAVAIVWLAIIPMISKTDLNTKIDLTLVTNEGYTLWDSKNRLAMVQVERSQDESDVIGFDIVFTLEGNSVTHFVGVMSGINSKSVYYINLTNYEGDLDSIKLIPIFKGGVIGRLILRLELTSIAKLLNKTIG